MIIDRNDMIIGTSTSLRACASMLCESNLGSVNKNAGWHPLKLLYKFSHLLADEHAIHCWQQACRSIQASLETTRYARSGNGNATLNVITGRWCSSDGAKAIARS